jgi:hypothetical protein
VDHFHVILDGYGEQDTGDVITKDGEVIGTWVLDPEDHPGFIPLGGQEVIIWNWMIGPFCKEILAWYEEAEAARLQAAAASPSS